MSEEQKHHSSDEGIELPTPTGWPIILAFGITLLFAGLVTSVFVSVTGILLIIAGAIGLISDVFPHPKHVYVPFAPHERRPEPIVTTGRSIEYLELGEEDHRAHVPRTIHPYSAGVLGGLIGGAVMAVLAIAYSLVTEGSFFYTINLLAAGGVPTLADADVETLKNFDVLGLVVASIIHVSLSIMVGLLYVVMLPMLPRRLEWFWGGIVIPLIWTALLWSSMGYINPALSVHVNWFWFTVCQVAFGLVAGFIIFKSARIETMQSWPMAHKLGVESKTRGKTTNGEKK